MDKVSHLWNLVYPSCPVRGPTHIHSLILNPNPNPKPRTKPLNLNCNYTVTIQISQDELQARLQQHCMTPLLLDHLYLSPLPALHKDCKGKDQDPHRLLSITVVMQQQQQQQQSFREIRITDKVCCRLKRSLKPSWQRFH